DESVEVKMQEGGRRYKPEEHMLNSLSVDPLREQFDVPVGKHHANVQADHGPASPEQKPHERTNLTSLVHTLAIVDPDNGEVLHVVKYFEQSNADYNVGDSYHCIPPEAEADGHHAQLCQAHRLTLAPLLQNICEEHQSDDQRQETPQ